MQEIQETRVWSLGWEDPWKEEKGNPLQYSCLKNPMERGAWQATQSKGWQRVGDDWANEHTFGVLGNMDAPFLQGAPGSWARFRGRSESPWCQSHFSNSFSLKQMPTTNVLRYSTGNNTQYPVINYNGKQYEKEYICVKTWVTLLYRRN